MADQEKTCSRCEKPLDTEGYPLWCQACRTTYRRELNEMKKAMAEGKGYLAGAEAIRREMMARLTHMNPKAQLRVDKVFEWLRDFPAPRPQA